MPPIKATAKKAAPMKKAAPQKATAAPKKAQAKPPVKDTDLPDEITDLGDGLSEFVKILIYGNPGSGKTPLALTAPNALTLECDRGLKSATVKGMSGKKWVITDYNDLTSAYEYMRDRGCKRFDWLIFDSITMFQERGLRQIMEDLHAVKSHREIWAADQGEYGQNMNRLSMFVRDIVDLPINVIITATALVSAVEQPDGSTVDNFWPNIQGKKMPQKIASYVDIVAHLQRKARKDDPDRTYATLSTRLEDGWYARDRYEVIGKMVNPTIPKVIASIEKKKKTQDTPTQGE